ncbi:PREDICTED: beta-fructofuranosidase, insoluble isoenzyme CWINV2-like [Tarenaya hassleriana]|uniref:beta-fructofuranosidase, insoluble isoenzyme CWINV2-like n=1 Tax=Tarenaya hassleriana TaxID=28532 RepID=UPI00053C3681|nr:PREDICTED: beta-fructofuranosidase, insoluble isoenzyme CWINV2-like [Tarenaya hassleriana]
MSVSKIAHVLLLLLVLISVNSNNGVKATHKVFKRFQSQSVDRVGPLHRTAFHFQPPMHWINDPNGPMYYKGIYHLFYQYNPKGAVWGNIVWAHSVSRDLINWKALEPAIYPSKWFDIGGTWSGSATIIPGKGPVILYTGLDKNATQMQNYAIPEDLSDPYLQKWVKPDDNPIAAPDETMNRTAFRDPTTAWLGKDGHWRMLVGSKRKHRGIAYLYRSRDFRKWVKSKHPLHSKQDTGMWECPDFFPVSLTDRKNGLDFGYSGPNIKHVLKVSLDLTRYEYYTLGKYHTDKDRYEPDGSSPDGWDGLRFDYGNFYASKTFFDSKTKRRILWGWANESDTVSDDNSKGWAGIQLIPRTVLLDSSGKQLVFWPIEEINTLRGKNVRIKNKKLKSGQRFEVRGITPAQADVEVTFNVGSLEKAEPFNPKWKNAQDLCNMKGSTEKGGVGPFGLITLATPDYEEYTPVFFRVFRDATAKKPKVLMCSDAKRSSIRTDDGNEPKEKMYKPSFAGFVDADFADGRISLRSLIDHSVVESFGAKGRTVITSRVYPERAVTKNAHLYVFNNGTQPVTVESLSAWSMKKPRKMN